MWELRTERPTEARAALAAAPEVLGMQWFPGLLRFQLAERGGPGAILCAQLASLGAMTEATPELEDAFVQTIGTAGRQEPGAVWSTAERGPRESVSLAVTLSGLTVRFGAFTAVDRVSLDISAGEVIGWLGPNGAGKTTLIRVLCGLQAPMPGAVVRVAGLDVLRAPRALKQRIGYMSQRFSLYPDLTVAENLAFFAGAYGLTGQARRQAIAWAVPTAGLDELLGRRAGELSGAERQRLALACAVMHRPTVLFLDEPTSGVDPIARQRFWQLIHNLAGAGMAVLVTTHYLEEARYCDRLGLMVQGRLIALGTVDELRTAAGERAEADMEAVFMAHVRRAREQRPEEAA